MATSKARVLIVGGGTAGLSIASRLSRSHRVSVTLLEPSETHYYQPLWTLVGAGDARREDTVRKTADYIPNGVEWIRDYAEEFLPEQNLVRTRGGKDLGYDYLVAVPGIQCNWSAVAGLADALGHDGVCSNYSYESVAKTWEFLKGFTGGTAIFTQPSTPVKCGGAPQKIAYLADDYMRRVGVRNKSRILFASGAGGLFAVKKYAATLERVAKRKDIETMFRRELVAVRAASREAVFRNLDTQQEQAFHYDFLHATPPMSAPDFVKRSPLANAAGWIDVDPATLRHMRFENVFAAGDASSAPTSKTGAAIRKQAPVLVENLLAAVDGRDLKAQYDGYTSCPLTTGYGKLVLAEFNYKLEPQETFPFDQSKERTSMYLMKKHLLPQLYWNGMLKGRA